MLNIFANETIYGGWTKKGCVPFKEAVPEDVFNAIDTEAVVTESDRGYGKSVCFLLNGGANKIYKALSTRSNLQVGDKVNKNTCFVTILSKTGENDIYRITETQE